MDRIATGMIIAVCAIAMSGGLVGDVMAESGVRAPKPAQPIASQLPVRSGPGSGRVLSLLLTLEALRAVPVLLDDPKA